MRKVHLALGAAAGLAVLLAVGAPALAQRGKSGQVRVPDSFAYEIRNGRRVPRGNRVTAPDGSWKEENKDDSGCIMVRQQTATGEYRETRKCD